MHPVFHVSASRASRSLTAWPRLATSKAGSRPTGWSTRGRSPGSGGEPETSRSARTSGTAFEPGSSSLWSDRLTIVLSDRKEVCKTSTDLHFSFGMFGWRTTKAVGQNFLIWSWWWNSSIIAPNRGHLQQGHRGLPLNPGPRACGAIVWPLCQMTNA